LILHSSNIIVRPEKKKREQEKEKGTERERENEREDEGRKEEGGRDRGRESMRVTRAAERDARWTERRKEKKTPRVLSLDQKHNFRDVIDGGRACANGFR